MSGWFPDDDYDGDYKDDYDDDYEDEDERVLHLNTPLYLPPIFF